MTPDSPAPVPPGGEPPDTIPYVPGEDREVTIWRAGFAAGRAAAHPDPPDMTNMCEGESPDHKPGITPAASPDERPTREAIEALPRWIAVEQAGYDANVNGPGPVMHAAVLLDDVLGLLAAPSHRGDEAAGTPAAVLNTEPSSGAASPDERLREALTADAIAAAVMEWDRWPYRATTDKRPAMRAAIAAALDTAALAAADREAPEPRELGDIDTGEGWYQT